MNRLRLLLAWISRWIDDAALGFLRVAGFLRPGRRIQLVEQTDGGFAPTQTDKRGCTASLGSSLYVEDNELVSSGLTKSQSMLAGSQVEVILAPSRFLFRELELPLRAAEFLEGVVREQIDRLTPWRSGDATFGWSAPAKLDDKRIRVTVAATTRASIALLEQAVARNGIDSLVMSTPAEGGVGSICVFSQRSGSQLRLRRWRWMLIGALALVGAATGITAAASVLVGGNLEIEQSSLQHEIGTRRGASGGIAGSQAERALAALNERKHITPPDVLVLEALSKTLPDSAYLTELLIEDGRLQIAGLGDDTPGLIRLIEGSGHFTRARFTAPTTNAPNEHGGRFRIEAHVEPIVASAR
jgi:general secretion pathway protein L